MKLLHILFLFLFLWIVCQQTEKEETPEEKVFFENEEKEFLKKIEKNHGKVEIGALDMEPNQEHQYMEYIRKKELENLEKLVLRSIKVLHEKDLNYEFEAKEDSEQNSHDSIPIQETPHDEL